MIFIANCQLPVANCQLPVANRQGGHVRRARNGMDPEELKRRMRLFALRMLLLADSLPRSATGRVLATQVGTSVAANYRAACKGRSKAEFVAKIGVAEEEADESQFWIEIVMEAKLVSASRLDPLLVEARELTAILAASRKTASCR